MASFVSEFLLNSSFQKMHVIGATASRTLSHAREAAQMLSLGRERRQGHSKWPGWEMPESPALDFLKTLPHRREIDYKQVPL